MNATTDPRLWVAIEPSIPVIERLVVLQEELEEPLHHLGAQVLWTAPDALRLILRSAPCADATTLPLLRDALSTIARSEPSFDFETKGTRLTPSLELPRTLVVGTGDGAAEIARLAQRVESALQSVGLAGDGRAFSSDLQVGRLRGRDRALDLRGLVESYRETVYGTTFCRELVLLTSEIRGTEVVWTTRTRVELGTGA